EEAEPLRPPLLPRVALRWHRPVTIFMGTRVSCLIRGIVGVAPRETRASRTFSFLTATIPRSISPQSTIGSPIHNYSRTNRLSLRPERYSQA
ncbi:unnamed protein product, partial [Dovyalis caffra]